MLERLEQQMDAIVGRMLQRPASAPYRRAWAPRIDVYDTEDAVVAVAELAGVDSDSVTIEIEGDVVAFGGRREAPTPPECADYLQLEIPSGEFERTLKLPFLIDAEQASATVKDGLLIVHLPKSRRGPTRVQVDVQPTE